MDAPDFRLDGKVALVTGAGRGIGLAIAQALASQGCAVALQDIDKGVAAAEVEKIKEAGGKGIALGGDLRDLSQADVLVGETVAQLGRLNVLVNNGAVQTAKRWTDLSVEEIESNFRANMTMPILLSQRAYPHLKADGHGRIINIGSVQELGFPEMLAYSMSKSGLHNMTRALAKELAKDGITVNQISPGYFNTYRNREDFKTPQELTEKGKRFVPMGRIGDPEDCAGLALLLAGPAGSYITGQTIFVDGGIAVNWIRGVYEY